MTAYHTTGSSAKPMERSASEYVAVLLDNGLVDDAYQTMRVQFDEGARAAVHGWPVYEWEPAARRMGYMAMAERLADDSTIRLEALDATAGECECYDLPDGRAHVCAACRAGRWDDEIPF